MQEINDTECIRMVLRGQKEYFRYLVSRYQSKAYGLCFKILKNQADAQEAAQEAFVKAYEALPSFRIDSSFSTWFYRIIYNTCMTKIRKDRFTFGLEPDHPALSNYRDDNEAVRSLDAEDMKALLQDAYQALNPGEVFMIELFYREECSIEEIASMTGLSQSNVKIKLFRARQKMYDRIKSGLKEEILIWQTK